MKTEPANIYEANGEIGTERDRLQAFNWPTEVSLESIGNLESGMSVLDVGAGSNTDLGKYVRQHNASYVAFDRNDDFLEQQKLAGSTVVAGDIRKLPFDDSTFDIAHVRFVIAHLGDDRLSAIKQVVGVTRPHGQAIFMDYDWTTANGSDAFNKLRDLLIKDMLFDASFGARLKETVHSAVGKNIEIASKRYTHPLMHDYAQILNLRGAANTDLRVQNASQELVEHCNSIFDQLQEESEAKDAPGFQFPDIVTVTATKSN